MLLRRKLACAHQIGRIARGRYGNQHVAVVHQVAELKAENVLKGEIVAQRGDFFNIVADRQHTEAALSRGLHGVFAKVAHLSLIHILQTMIMILIVNAFICIVR